MRAILNPDQLAAAYDFVRTIEPFNLWPHEELTQPLPHSDEIEFVIIGAHRHWGSKQRKLDGTFTISYSDKAPSQASHLVMYMAHEVIHLYQDINKLETRSMHNRDFVGRAERVCAIHGYDLLLFL